MFRKMAIQESQVVKIDTSAFGKIHVELKENVKPESLSIFLYSIFKKGSGPSFTVHIIDRTHLKLFFSTSCHSYARQSLEYNIAPCDRKKVKVTLQNS